MKFCNVGPGSSLRLLFTQFRLSNSTFILGDPGADSGGEGKSKQAEKYGTKEK